MASGKPGAVQSNMELAMAVSWLTGTCAVMGVLLTSCGRFAASRLLVCHIPNTSLALKATRLTGIFIPQKINLGRPKDFFEGASAWCAAVYCLPLKGVIRAAHSSASSQ